MTEAQPISFGRRIGELARLHPGRSAIVFAPQTGGEISIDWQQLDQESNRVARTLAAKGCVRGDTVVVSIGNCAEHYLATLGVWKLGACVLPLNPSLAPREQEQLLEIARPKVIVVHMGCTLEAGAEVSDLHERSNFSADALPDRIAQPGKAIASGGSTGRPKIIRDPSPWAKRPGEWIDVLGGNLGMRAGQTQLVAGPLFHNGAFLWSQMGLFEDHTLIVMERFDASKALALIEKHRVNFAFLVPTMMQRMLRVTDVERRDFSSVEGFFHAGAPCPPWAKEGWIRLIGGEKLYEMYGATEAVGFTMIRGDDWLEHRGSVGRPYNSELRILDERGADVPHGTVGEIFTRFAFAATLNYEYVGAPPAKTTPDGFVSVGDLGWVDANGYLFLADRRTDLILSGGANIYPAEIEAALTEHPGVADAVVVGIPDEEWGQRVHAIVQPRDLQACPSVIELDKFCRERITAYRIPKSYEFLKQLPRNEAGKVRRSDLAKERVGGWTSAMIPAPHGNVRSLRP